MGDALEMWRPTVTPAVKLGRLYRARALANDWGTRTEPGGPVTDKEE